MCRCLLMFIQDIVVAFAGLVVAVVKQLQCNSAQYIQKLHFMLYQDDNLKKNSNKFYYFVQKQGVT